MQTSSKHTDQIDGLGLGFLSVAAPGLAVEPLLGQGLDGHLVDHVVRQVLIQVGQGVGILRQTLVLAPQPVTRRNATELLQVHHVQGTGRKCLWCV